MTSEKLRKKAQGLPLNTIVIALLVIIVLVVVIVFFIGNFSGTSDTVGENTNQFESCQVSENSVLRIAGYTEADQSRIEGVNEDGTCRTINAKKIPGAPCCEFNPSSGESSGVAR